jgi:cytochrome P450
VLKGVSVTTNEAGVPVFDLSFGDWEFNQNPYDVLEEVRAAGPVVYNSRAGRYMVTSYRNCAKVLGNVKEFNSQSALEDTVRFFGGITMMFLDTPRHDQMRGVWSQDFQRASLEDRRRLVEEVVMGRVDPFIDRVLSGEIVDAIPNMTRGIPTLVIAHMLGIQTDMFEQFSAWSDAMGASTEASFDPSPRGERLAREGVEATAALNEYIVGQIAERREQGSRGKPSTDDLIGKMVHSEFGRTSMEESELVASNTQLVFAGNETTASLMAHTLVALATHPDQRKVLEEDRSLIPQAIEEVHRWSTVTQAGGRRACSDHSEIEGIRIPNGSEISPLQGAGNRDPQRWESPATFDITRIPIAHLGFGFGMHSCLGLNLARLEMEVWLNRLLDRLPNYQLAGPVDYGTNFILRGPIVVPIAS